MAPYLCFRFRIFNRFILKEFVSQVEGGPHLLQSCFHVAQNDLPLATKEMHPSFENLTSTNTPSLQTSLIDTYHDTSLRSILEDDFIPSTSKACIHSCSGKGAGLWLVTKPFICSFRITHSTFTSTLCFRLGLIQPSTFSPLTYKCGHKLHTSNMHLVDCPFKGQQIITHDTIQESGHDVWRKQWYTFTSKVSLRANLYMTRKDQVVIVDVMVIGLM